MNKEKNTREKEELIILNDQKRFYSKENEKLKGEQLEEGKAKSALHMPLRLLYG